MKTVFIAGGNSGIGKATAIELAKKGYKMIIHGRNAKKTEEAIAEIKTKSGNTNVDFIVADLSSISEMKRVALEVQKKTDVIDILVLSTGVILPSRIETKDGLDAAFATQYLCRFALANLLKPQLEKAQSPRIVMVGAPTMKKAKIHFDDLSLKNHFSMMKSMGQAMLANHMFVQEFAKRNSDNKIKINMHHVGLAKTGVIRESGFFLKSLVKIFGTTAEKACANTLYLADNEKVNFSGYFLPKPGKPEEKTLIQFDSVITEKLWNKSKELIA